jgi:predicted metal-dependent hydrolase
MSSDISPTPKNKGGRPKSPLSLSNQLKTFGDIHTKALDELQALNLVISKEKPDVATILGYLDKTEQVTASIFRASKARMLLRGMLLSEAMAAFKVENPGGNWKRYFENSIEPVFGISKKSEELSRTVWHRWLAASEEGKDALGLLNEGGTVHDFNKALKGLVDGDDEQAEPKLKPSAHDRIQKVRKQVGKQIAATTVGMNSDDEAYEQLVRKVQEALADLEDYVSSKPADAPVGKVIPRSDRPVRMGKPLQPPASMKERINANLQSLGADIPLTA